MSQSDLSKESSRTKDEKEIPHSLYQIKKEESISPKEMLNQLILILLLMANKITGQTLTFEINKINKVHLLKEFLNLELGGKKGVSFDTKNLYKYLIEKTRDYLKKKNPINFGSCYSILYFWRIITYLSELVKSTKLKENLAEDNLIKIFFYLLFLFFEEKIGRNNAKNKIDLDETFFKGTFIELTEKYSSIEPYKDSEGIINFINTYKALMDEQIMVTLEFDFNYIKEILQLNRNNKDDFMNDMYIKAGNILYEIEKVNRTKNYNLPIELMNKLKEFYSNENYLIFTNYISENERYYLKNNIDKEFLESIKKDYFPSEFDFSHSNNSINNEMHNEKLDKYLNHKNKYFKRMKYSWFPEVIKFDLNDEFSIFAFYQDNFNSDFNSIYKFKNKLENLTQNNIIKNILNENDFYEKYFSILQSKIVKDFFTSNLIIKENEKFFQKQNYETDDSENFNEVYSDFMKIYNRKDENYKKFKDLIIYKILPFGDRAYTLRELKKIVINPAQFFLGNDIKKDSDIRTILEGYIMIILLHETEHFLRLIDKNKKVFPDTPKQKEGGKFFIKYLFDVYSFNHINLEQANKILNINNWKNHNELKKIFVGQLEDIEEENGEILNEFFHNYFNNALSFFTNKEIISNDKKSFNLNLYLKKY